MRTIIFVLYNTFIQIRNICILQQFSKTAVSKGCQILKIPLRIIKPYIHIIQINIQMCWLYIGLYCRANDYAICCIYLCI